MTQRIQQQFGETSAALDNHSPASGGGCGCGGCGCGGAGDKSATSGR